MGRLTYVNRKSEGLKMAEIVSRDLLKRVAPGSTSRAAQRDPELELDVSDRKLTDEGFAAVASALVKSTQNVSETGVAFHLHELVLKNNELTVGSLKELIPLIKNKLPSYLRHLDLSNNLISVQTSEDVKTWEEFLQSFARCCVLQKLDLSGNTLGPKAFEVLARVFVREHPIDPSSPDPWESDDDSDSDTTLVASGSKTTVTMIRQMLKKMDVTTTTRTLYEEGKEVNKPLSLTVKGHVSRQGLSEAAKQAIMQGHNTDAEARAKKYHMTKGLHSIPYIVLSNTAMDDVCAYYLSYVVATHLTPKLLVGYVPDIRSAHLTHQINAFKEEIPQCRGLIYFPNELLGNDGLKVLQMAEKKREISLEEALEEDRSDDEEDHAAPNSTLSESSASSKQVSSHNAPKHRVSGSVGGESSALAGGPLDALSKARSRIEVAILESPRRFDNDLWRTALTMVSISRPLQLELPHTHNPFSPRTTSAVITDAAQFEARRSPRQHPRKMSDTFPPMTPLAPANSNRQIRLRHSHPGKPVAPIPAPTDASDNPYFSSYPPMHPTRKPYRSDLLFGFTVEVWQRILGLAAGADGIVSWQQQNSILYWTADRDTLRQQMARIGHKHAIRTWHILHELKCLGYEQDEK